MAVVHLYYLGVAPFPGATTGTGGRIRDVQATGRGAHVIAGTAGYSFGNLHIPSELTFHFYVIYMKIEELLVFIDFFIDFLKIANNGFHLIMALHGAATA